MTLAPGGAAMPRGLLKLAATPTPSAKASAPLPARALTAPDRDTARTRLLSESHTYTSPTASITSTPAGRAKAAAVPWPLEKDVLPLPASVEALHTQGGSALSPAAAQFAAARQGTAGAGVPPGQKKPGAQAAQEDAEQRVPGAQGGHAACAPSGRAASSAAAQASNRRARRMERRLGNGRQPVRNARPSVFHHHTLP